MRERNNRFLLIVVLMILSFTFYAIKSEESVSASSFDNIEVDYSSDKVAEVTLSSSKLTLEQSVEILVKTNQKENITRISNESSGFSIESETIKNKNKIEIVLNFYSLLEEDYKYDVLIHFDDESIMKVSIYGYVNDGVLYLSDSSYDTARKASYYSMYENQLIDNDTLDFHLQSIDNEAISNLVVTNTTESISQQLLVENLLIEEEGMVMASSSSGNTYINGTLSWIDDLGNTHPLRNIIVEVWDDDPIDNTRVGTTSTDSNGDYYLAFDNVTWFENGGLDLYLKVYSKGMDVDVQDGSNTYKISTLNEPNGLFMNVATGSTTTISFNVEMVNDSGSASDTGRAFQISQALIYGNKYVNAMGDTVPDVTLNYPTNESCSCYFNSSDRIELQAAHYASWDIILHEYGHHLQYEYSIINTPGGSHTITNNMINFTNTNSYTYNKDEGVRKAWGESWPTVFALQVTHYYSTELVNVVGVNDTNYDNPTWNFNLESGGNDGEGQEAAIMAVLYDMYDSTSGETHDIIDLTDHQMWDIVTNSNAKTFSEFANYIYQTQSSTVINGFSELIEEYGMSPSSLTISGSISVNPSTFTWSEGGCISMATYENDEFDLIFYDEYNNEYYRIENVSSPYTPTPAEWNTVLNHYGNFFSVRVSGKETSSPTTGEYISAKLYLGKSSIETMTESVSIYDITRYFEDIVTLYPTQEIEYTVFFQTSGKKIIQTFGSKNTYMYIYDMDGNLITYDYNDGYSLNSFITFESSAYTSYVIKVRFASSNQNGEIKFGIYPTIYSGINDFEDIHNVDMSNSLSRYATLHLNSTSVFSLTINETRSYTIETHQYVDTVDTYLYIIDVTTSEIKLYNDDSGVGLYSKITTNLEAGHTYLVIVAAYNITTQDGQYKLTVTKN